MGRRGRVSLNHSQDNVRGTHHSEKREPEEYATRKVVIAKFG
jgi:hypothetical protein